MIDSWFRADLQAIYRQYTVAVFIDESGDAEFLLKTLEEDYTIQPAHSDLEELHVKYRIEKAQPSHERFLIYTRSKKEDLTFIREYCETCGCLEIRSLQNYIKDKLTLTITLSKKEWGVAAKVSVGKPLTYWRDISDMGATAIFNLNEELLPFVHEPERYSKEMDDASLMEIFCQKVNEWLGQDDLNKPVSTLAGDVVTAMLDGLAKDRCDKILESVYNRWLDSSYYCKSFKKYLGRYKLGSDLDIWSVSVHHPFRLVDEQWLAEIGKNISDNAWVLTVLPKLQKRNQSRQANTLHIRFWGDVIALLVFDQNDIAYLSSFSECVEFYKTHFYKLDTAIRNLYEAFLNKTALLEPFQARYKDYLSGFLDKWFNYWSDYNETQTGTLQRIIDDTGGVKTAVIVGDGVAYEIAQQVAKKVKGAATPKTDSILADIPSETENNMSRIYMANGVIEAVQGNREKYLVAQNPDVTIDFIRLDDVTEEARSGQVLICTYKDVDYMGDKFHQEALKYFSNIIDFLAKKISHLLASGYAKVYLITDHGFVLTGLLSDSDKVSVSPTGHFDKSERHIWTQTKQADQMPGLIEVEKSYKKFNYLYFATTINPFKTPGLYGFSHGGISPQELVTPYFCWEPSESSVASLSVSIENKGALNDVTGDLFSIKIQADKGVNDLFSMKRTVYFGFFANRVQVSKSEVFTIQCNEQLTKDYTFDGHSELDVQLLDAATKQLLDKAVVKQNKDRDLGGLL